MRTIHIAEQSVISVRILVMGTSVCVAADALLRFPDVLRWCMFAAVVWSAGWLIRKRVLPSTAAQKSSVHLALEIEKDFTPSQGRLASGVEFAQDRAMDFNPLAQSVLVQATSLVDSGRIAALAKTDRLRRDLLALSIVLLVWVGFAVVSPSLAKIGVMRVMSPWLAVEWPARTGVRSTTFATHHPKRASLALRADLFRGDPASEPVWVRLRTTRGDVVGQWEELQLVHQGDTRFERLIDPGADAIDFTFLTRDVETQPQHIDFVEAPQVTSAVVLIDGPTYAELFEQQRIDLGRAIANQGRIAQPILEGSRIQLDITTEPPLSLAQPDKMREWERETFNWTSAAKGDDSPPGDLSITGKSGLWSVAWTADKSRTLALRLVDENGVRNIDDILISMEVVADAPAEAVMVEPGADETVLPSAQISVAGEGRDDVGLTSIMLVASRATDWNATLVQVEAKNERQIQATATFDLTTANAKPGDVFEVIAVVSDAFREGGIARDPTKSSPRRLRVLTRAQFEEETRNALAAVRQGAMRVDEREKNLVQRNEAPSAQVRPQTEISERVAVLKKMVAALQERINKNQASDSATESLLSAAADILDNAASRSNEARDLLQEAAQKQAQESDPSVKAQISESLEQAKVAQGEVRRELEDLSELLEHDKDAWVAARKLERLAEAIQKASDERSKAGARTIGRNRSDLSADEAAGLERAADATQQAAQTAADVMAELKERSQQVRKEDPQRSASLEQAAKRGEDESLSSRMEQAQQATRQNKLDEARAASQEAMQTVARMIEDLADDQKARSETLRRRLATLAEAIEQLLTQARSAEEAGFPLISADGTTVSTAAAAVGQEAAKISLNASGVADEGRAAGPSAQRVVRLIERAAEAEGRAAASMGATPPQVSAGYEQLVRGKSLFEEALDVVRQQEKKNEEAQRQERAAKLAAEYAALCDRQEGLITATAALVSSESNRRALVEARRLGVEQEQIGKAIEQVATDSEDVRKSATFMEATGLAVEAAGHAADDLRGGLPVAGTLEMEREVLETLRGLAGALAQAAKKKDDPFAQESEQVAGGQGGGGGGAGGQEEPLIAPLAELKMLRALQQRIYDRTKSAASDAGAASSLTGLAKRQENIATLADALREAVEAKMSQPGGQVEPKVVDPQPQEESP